MKKVLLTGLLLSCMASPVWADANKGKTFGTIDTIAVEENTFTLKGDDGNTYLFNVNEATEMERNNSWFDEDITMTDLKTGDRVQIEYFSDNPDFLIVDELEVFPPKKK
ncbi:MAG: hypothetical protein IJY17_01105 [Alphaproteobacteria bacterium]|nr:hypothetical protein [Alphaproteobacteria bacterium]